MRSGDEPALTPKMEEVLLALVEAGAMKSSFFGFTNAAGTYPTRGAKALCDRGLAAALPPFAAGRTKRQIAITEAGTERAEAILRRAAAGGLGEHAVLA